MYTRDGIVYAGNPEPLLEVCGVRALDAYRLWVKFNTGECKTVDISDMLQHPAFIPLKDERVFKSVYIDYGAPVWNNGTIDISPDYLYKHGVDAAEQ